MTQAPYRVSCVLLLRVLVVAAEDLREVFLLHDPAEVQAVPRLAGAAHQEVGFAQVPALTNSISEIEMQAVHAILPIQIDDSKVAELLGKSLCLKA